MYDFKPAQETSKQLPWVQVMNSDFKASFSVKPKGEIYLVLTHKVDAEIHIPIDDAQILKKFLNENI